MKKTVWVLVGQIASGKSTWVNNQDMEGVIISKDDLRKNYAYMIYQDYIYDDYLEPIIQNICELTLYACLHLEVENIIIDETNMTRKSRSWIFDVRDISDYRVVAVVFPDFGEDVHVQRRMKDNHGQVTETKWREVYRDKKKRYQEPIEQEGFDEIIYIKQ